MAPKKVLKKDSKTKKASSNKKPSVKKTNTTAAATKKKTVTTKKSDKTAKKKTTKTTKTTTKAKAKTTKKKFETKNKNNNSKTSKKENSNSNKSSGKKTNTTAAANKKKNSTTSTTKSKENKKKKQTSTVSKKNSAGSASALAAVDDDDYDFDEEEEEPKNLPEWMKALRSDTCRYNKIFNLKTTFIYRRSIRSICRFLRNYVCNTHSESEEHARYAKDALVWLSDFIKHSDTAEAWTNAIFEIIHHNQFPNGGIFGDEEIRDSFVKIAQYVAEDDYSIFGTARYEDNFSTYQFSDDFPTDDYDMEDGSFRTYADEDGSFRGYDDDDDGDATAVGGVSSYCRALRRVVECHPDNRELYGTKQIRDVVLSLADLAESLVGSDFVWITMVAELTNKMHDNQKLFGVVEVRDTILKIAGSVRDEDVYQVEEFLRVMYNLIAPHDDDIIALFAIAKVKDLLLSFSDRVKNNSSAFYWCSVVNAITRSTLSLFEDDKVTALAMLNVVTMNQTGSGSVVHSESLHETLVHTPETLDACLLLIRNLLLINRAFFNDYFSQICHVLKILKQFVIIPHYTQKLEGWGKNDEFIIEWNNYDGFDYDDDHKNDVDDGNKITGVQFCLLFVVFQRTENQ